MVLFNGRTRKDMGASEIAFVGGLHCFAVGFFQSKPARQFSYMGWLPNSRRAREIAGAAGRLVWARTPLDLVWAHAAIAWYHGDIGNGRGGTAVSGIYFRIAPSRGA